MTKLNKEAYTELVNALQDFVDYWDDPNMPMEELVSRAREALDKVGVDHNG